MICRAGTVRAMRRLGFLLLAASGSVAATSEGCNDVQIFLARGHGEAIPGNQIVIVDAICGEYPGSCGNQSIAYNATDDSPDTICQSQYEGVLLATEALTEYGTRCPDAKLVLSGWSQGGALITDVVAGGGGINLTGTCDQPITEPLSPDGFPGNRVAAVVTYGELHHNANQSWNFGNGSAMDGLYPRTSSMLTALSLWTGRFQDYCVVEDPACAQGSDVSSHSGYFVGDYWPGTVAGFVLSKL